MPIIKQILLPSAGTSESAKLLLAPTSGRGLPRLVPIDQSEIPTQEISFTSGLPISGVFSAHEFDFIRVIPEGENKLQICLNPSSSRTLEHIPKSELKAKQDAIRYVILVRGDKQNPSEIFVIERSNSPDFKVVYASRDSLAEIGPNEPLQILTCLGEKEINRRETIPAISASRAVDPQGRSVIRQAYLSVQTAPTQKTINPMTTQVISLLEKGKNRDEKLGIWIQKTRLENPEERDRIIEAAKLEINKANQFAYEIGAKRSVRRKPNEEIDENLIEWVGQNPTHKFSDGIIAGLKKEEASGSITLLKSPSGLMTSGPVAPPKDLFKSIRKTRKERLPQAAQPKPRLSKQDKVYKLVVDSLKEGKDLASVGKYRSVERHFMLDTPEKRNEVITLLKGEINKGNRLAYRMGKLDKVRKNLDGTDDVELNTWRNDSANTGHAFSRGLQDKRFEVSERDKKVSAPGESNRRSGKTEASYQAILLNIKTKLVSGETLDDYEKQKVRNFVPKTDQERTELCTLAKDPKAVGFEMAYYFGRSTYCGRKLDGKLDPEMYNWAGDNPDHALSKALLDRKYSEHKGEVRDKEASTLRIKQKIDAYRFLANLCQGKAEDAENMNCGEMPSLPILKIAGFNEERDNETIKHLGKNQNLVRFHKTVNSLINFAISNPQHALSRGASENPMVFYLGKKEKLDEWASAEGVAGTPLETTIKENITKRDLGTLEIKRKHKTHSPRSVESKLQRQETIYQSTLAALKEGKDPGDYECVRAKKYLCFDTEEQRSEIISLLKSENNKANKLAYTLGKSTVVRNKFDGSGEDVELKTWAKINYSHVFGRGVLDKNFKISARDQKISARKVTNSLVSKSENLNLLQELANLKTNILSLIERLEERLKTN